MFEKVRSGLEISGRFKCDLNLEIVEIRKRDGHFGHFADVQARNLEIL